MVAQIFWNLNVALNRLKQQVEFWFCTIFSTDSPLKENGSPRNFFPEVSVQEIDTAKCITNKSLLINLWTHSWLSNFITRRLKLPTRNHGSVLYRTLRAIIFPLLNSYIKKRNLSYDYAEPERIVSRMKTSTLVFEL